jgi:cyclophilin family peptidyl-prolyl cis-trans isomerase
VQATYDILIPLRRSVSVLLETSFGDIVVDLCVKEVPFDLHNFPEAVQAEVLTRHISRVEVCFIAQRGVS